MRYVIFSGNKFYPKGGVKDLKGFCVTLQEAVVLLNDSLVDVILDYYLVTLKGLKIENHRSEVWGHIYDLEKKTICYDLDNVDDKTLNISIKNAIKRKNK